MALAQWTDDQVFNQLDSGLRWPGSTITYAFAGTSAAMFSGAGEGAGFSALGTSAQASARLALTLWDDLIAPDMQQVANTTTYNSANIEFGMSSNVGYGYAYYPSVGSVWFSSNYSSGANDLVSPIVGRHGFYAYVHEIGHALGLDHPGNYDGVGTFQPSSYQDSTVYSIMSYFGPNWSAGSDLVAWADWVGADGVLYSPQTPMLSDIYAVQRMYGAETTTRVGDTVYGFNSNISDVTAAVYDFAKNQNPILTIFDSAGSDTLDFSGWNTPSVINLGPGTFSSSNAMTNNIAIAFSSQIENAVGGGGSDVIDGNALSNRLFGGAGDDFIYALQGNDIVIGGLGNDTIDGGDGIDYAYLEATWDAMTWSTDQNPGYLTVVQGNLGTDKIKNVEFFRDTNNVVKSLAELTGAPPAAAPYAGSFSITANSASLIEGTGNSSAYRFTVTLSQASTAAQTVQWALVFGSGSGYAGANDFSGPLSGTITIAAGQDKATLDVIVVGDTSVESDENFSIALANPSNGLTLATASATGRIVNDDVQVVAPAPAPAPVQASSLTLTGSSASEALSGGTGDDKLYGMGGNDTLSGGAGNDLLDGGSGSDRMSGGSGDDVYVIDSTRDSVTEYANEGIDAVRTALSKYTLTGHVEWLEYIGTGAFAGTGNALANKIVGGNGNDLLNGGAGNDVLIGGAGADRFQFNTALGPENIDLIQDFNASQDKIVLEDAIFASLRGKGKSAGWQFHAGSDALSAKDHILYDDHTGALYYDPDGNGSAAAIHFATVSTGLSLTQSNFQVI